MQNRAISDAYRIEYAPFEDLFRDQPRRIHWAVNQPLPDAIQDLHLHDALEVGYCREGAGIFIIDGEVLPFSAPCATVIYPGQLHKACSIGEPASRWLFITFRAQGLFGGDTGALARLPWNGPPARACLSADHGLVDLAREAAAELEGRREEGEDCARGLLAALLLRHVRLCRQTGEEASVSAHRPYLQRLAPVIQAISREYREDLTVEGLARRFYLHPATLREWFQKAMGLSPQQYLHRVRISAACSLLLGTSRPVLDIVLEVGYHSASSFGRQFRAVCGCTPKAYRLKR